MYNKVGELPNARQLWSRAAGLVLDASGTGYGSTSDRFLHLRELYYNDLAALFPGDWPYSMLAVVFANGTIPPHKDGPLAKDYQRYHLVLQSNPNAWSFHDGVWQQLKENGIYVMDCTQYHAAVNWGAEPRVHLVIDTAEVRL